MTILNNVKTVRKNLISPSLRLRRNFPGFAFITPAMILLFVFSLLPIILAVVISLYDFPLVAPDRRVFINLENYRKAFNDVLLRKAFINTAYYALWQMPLQTIIGLLLALLIYKPIKGVGIFRVGYYLPVVISMIVASILWKVLLDSQNGLINSLLQFIGFPRQPLLTSETQALPAIAIMLTWKYVGFSMLIFTAGLQSIPTDLLEASEIDGANKLQNFWYIILPLLKNATLYVIVMNSINAAKIFTPIYIMTQGGPNNSTMVVIYYIYREVFHYGRMGYGAAVAVIFSVIILLLAILQLRILRGSES